MKIRLRFEYSGKTKAGMRLPETYKAFLKTHCGLFPRKNYSTVYSVGGGGLLPALNGTFLQGPSIRV